MKRLLIYRFGEKYVHIPKLIGAFILVAAFLEFIAAGALMFESWDNVKEVQTCLKATQIEPTMFVDCQKLARQSIGINIRSSQELLSLKQISSVLLHPISLTFFWLAVLLVGILIYRTGTIVIPIQETIKPLKEKQLKKVKRKKKKK